jgi:hypothetical protein
MSKRASVVAAKALAWRRKLARMDGIQGRFLRWYDPWKSTLRAGVLAESELAWAEVHPAGWEYREGPHGDATHGSRSTRTAGLSGSNRPNRKRGRVIASITAHGRVRSYLGGIAVSGQQVAQG